MSAQPTLFAAEVAGNVSPATHLPNGEPRTLTERQQSAWDLVRSTPGGVTVAEVGANQHERRGKHRADERCDWCASEGLGILRSVALRPLVIRRKGGRWQPRNPKDAVRPSVTRREPTEDELRRNPFAGLEL